MLDKLRTLTNLAEDLELLLCDLPISKDRDQADDYAEALRMHLEKMLAEAEAAAVTRLVEKEKMQ